MLEPMTNDPVNYVRQGALIASALIMIQQTEVTCPKVSLKGNWFYSLLPGSHRLSRLFKYFYKATEECEPVLEKKIV